MLTTVVWNNTMQRLKLSRPNYIDVGTGDTKEVLRAEMIDKNNNMYASE